PRVRAEAARPGGAARQHAGAAGFGRGRGQRHPQREPRRDPELRQRRPVAAGPDAGRAALADPRPAPHQRPTGGQSDAVPARPRRTQGVRAGMKTEGTAMQSPNATARSRATAFAAAAVACVLLGGCSLLGGGNQREPATIYAPDTRVAPDPAWPAASWQLTISPTTAARMIDSLRIAVRPTPAEVQ